MTGTVTREGRFELPSWACVAEKRRGHILRVTSLLADWAEQMRVDSAERREWIDAGLWHDAIKDLPEIELRALAGPDSDLEAPLLHGPAVAGKLTTLGEARSGVLEAIRFHSIGAAHWGRTGQALYMADFLEPGRGFAKRDRAFLAAQVPHDFNGAFRQVVRSRLEWSLREGHSLHPETIQLWNQVR